MLTWPVISLVICPVEFYWEKLPICLIHIISIQVILLSTTDWIQISIDNFVFKIPWLVDVLDWGVSLLFFLWLHLVLKYIGVFFRGFDIVFGFHTLLFDIVYFECLFLFLDFYNLYLLFRLIFLILQRTQWVLSNHVLYCFFLLLFIILPESQSFPTNISL